MSESNPMKFHHDMEQLEALTASIAGLLSTYYKELIDKGIPEILAAQIIRDYALKLMFQNDS